MDEVKKVPCGTSGCKRPARMAISTSRPSRENVWSRVWYDDRTAPASASRYCRTHGIEVLTQLAQALVDEDDS